MLCAGATKICRASGGRRSCRISAPPENAARLMEEFSRLDVRPLLADIQVP